MAGKNVSMKILRYGNEILQVVIAIRKNDFGISGSLSNRVYSKFNLGDVDRFLFSEQ